VEQPVQLELFGQGAEELEEITRKATELADDAPDSMPDGALLLVLISAAKAAKRRGWSHSKTAGVIRYAFAA